MEGTSPSSTKEQPRVRLWAGRELGPLEGVWHGADEHAHAASRQHVRQQGSDWTQGADFIRP